MLVTGLYMPEPAVLKSVREEILFNGEEFVRNIGQAQDFSLNRENALKRVPAGFPTDSPYAEYLRLKDFCLERPVSEAFLLSPRPARKGDSEFRHHRAPSTDSSTGRWISHSTKCNHPTGKRFHRKGMRPHGCGQRISGIQK